MDDGLVVFSAGLHVEIVTVMGNSQKTCFVHDVIDQRCL